MASKSAARRAWRVARGKIDPRCDYCGEITFENVKERDPRRATVEDMTPLSKGGPNNRSNWALACSECNQAKGDNCVAERVEITQPKKKHYRMTQMERRQRKCRKPQRMTEDRIEEIERLARLASLPFSLYAPIPGVPDEAFR